MTTPQSPATPTEGTRTTEKPAIDRYFVRLSKRGKTVMLTLNGGQMFADYDLAYRGALASREKHKWTRIQIDTVRFAEGSDEGELLYTLTIGPKPKQPKVTA